MILWAKKSVLKFHIQKQGKQYFKFGMGEKGGTKIFQKSLRGSQSLKHCAITCSTVKSILATKKGTPCYFCDLEDNNKVLQTLAVDIENFPNQFKLMIQKVLTFQLDNDGYHVVIKLDFIFDQF